MKAGQFGTEVDQGFIRSASDDFRSGQTMRMKAVSGSILNWREQQCEGPLNLGALHEQLVAEYGYASTYRSIQLY